MLLSLAFHLANFFNDIACCDDERERARERAREREREKERKRERGR